MTSKIKTAINKINPFSNKKNALPKRTPAEEAMGRVVKDWSPPLMNLFEDDIKEYKNIIKVRILSGDVETDFVLKFDDGPLYAHEVTDAIQNKLGLSNEAKKCFSLWIIATELELQLKAGTELFDLYKNWNMCVFNFTHYPEAYNTTHPINRFWFVFRREASLTKAVEETLDTDHLAISLLYGEAKRNVLTGRYVCSIENAVVLGALQLALMLGQYDLMKHTKGFLVENDLYRRLLPGKLMPHHTAEEWETLFTEKYRQYSKLSESNAQLAYVQYVREWACYGSSLFPGCHKRPPAGFFEFRKERFYIGVGPTGIVVIDPSKNRYIFAQKWDDVVIRRSPDSLRLKYFSNGKKKTYKVYTPQAGIACNLSIRCKYLFLKESNIEKQRIKDLENKFGELDGPLEKMRESLHIKATSEYKPTANKRNSFGLPTPPPATIVPFLYSIESRATTIKKRISVTDPSNGSSVLSKLENEVDDSNAFSEMETELISSSVQANTFANYFTEKTSRHSTSFNYNIQPPSLDRPTSKSNDSLNRSHNVSKRILSTSGEFLSEEESVSSTDKFATDSYELKDNKRKSLMKNVKNYFHDDVFTRQKDSLAPPRITMNNAVETDVLHVKREPN